jgi:hypothetical protein
MDPKEPACAQVLRLSTHSHTLIPPLMPHTPPPSPPGLQQYYPDPSVLVGQLVCVAANLKPAKLAGEPSQAMVLAAEATGAGGQTIVKALQPPGAWAVLVVARTYGGGGQDSIECWWLIIVTRFSSRFIVNTCFFLAFHCSCHALPCCAIAFHMCSECMPG